MRGVLGDIQKGKEMIDLKEYIKELRECCEEMERQKIDAANKNNQLLFNYSSGATDALRKVVEDFEKDFNTETPK